jgi:hypothetical protein
MQKRKTRNLLDYFDYQEHIWKLQAHSLSLMEMSQTQTYTLGSWSLSLISNNNTLIWWGFEGEDEKLW